MKKIIFLLLTFLIYHNSIAQGGKIISKGVLYSSKDKIYTLPDSLQILNKDETSYLFLKKINNDSINVKIFENKLIGENIKKLESIFPFYFYDNKKYNIPLPQNFTRAYYPNDGVIVIDANKINNKYFEIFINGEWKFIKSTTLKYKNWESFLKQTFIKLSVNNRIYIKKNLNSKELIYPNDISFKVLKVRGDWIKVECNDICEECNSPKKIRGWVKWKSDKILLINIVYIC